MFSVVFRDAMIIDGTGCPAYSADLAITGDRIAEIGQHLGPAHRTVSARGLALMPGVIDGHTHYDAQILWDPTADPSLPLGTTTIVIGNCGFTIAPCRAAHRDLIMRNLTHVEGMSFEALRAGIPWRFEHFGEYLDLIETEGAGPNVASFIGHSAIRTYVMGTDASHRIATDSEIAHMQRIVRDAMACGAVGLSSSTSEPHNGECGVPMPSRLADDRELRGLVTAMGETGRGVFMLTRGSKTTIEYLESLAALSGRSVMVAMLHNSANPERVFRGIEEMRDARLRGNQVIAQIACLPLTMDFTLKNAYPFEDLSAWRPAMESAAAALPEVFASPHFRAAVKDDLLANKGMRLFNSDWQQVHITRTAQARHRDLEGMSIAELSEREQKHPLDCMLDLSLSEALETEFAAVLLNSDEDAVARLIADPANYVALSDAGAHLTFLCDAGFALHLIAHWARDRQVLSVEAAVQRVTQHPAQLFGIKDRGTLVPGQAADLVLFDPATVGVGAKRRVNDLPGGAYRLKVDAEGIRGVWVNGIHVVDGGRLVGDVRRSGRVLRDFSSEKRRRLSPMQNLAAHKS